MLLLLTAEAEGTTSHPRAGEIVYVPVISTNGTVDMRRGRREGSGISLFPHPAEIRDMLEEIGSAPEPAYPVVERIAINSQIPNEILFMFNYGSEGWTLPSLQRHGATLTHQAPLDPAAQSDSASAAARFERQLAAGEVELPAPKPREQRVIDLE